LEREEEEGIVVVLTDEPKHNGGELEIVVVQFLWVAVLENYWIYVLAGKRKMKKCCWG